VAPLNLASYGARMSAPKFEPHAAVVQLVTELNPRGLGEEALAGWCGRLVALPHQERQDIAAQLVALGVKIEASGGQGAQQVLAELIVLAAAAYGNRAVAQTAFENAGARPSTTSASETHGPPGPQAPNDKLWK
jgi:hypothetical protein